MGMTLESGLTSAQFVAAMEHSPIGTALVGLDGRWIWTNIAIRTILCYSHDELQSLTFQDITHPDDLNMDLDLAEKLISGEGSAYQMDKRYLRKDGSIVWCLLAVSLVRGENGAADYFISKVQDISERKANEFERAALTERLTLATQAGGVGVWEWDIATNALIWDARMFELYDIDPARTPDYMTFLNAVDPEHRERVNQLLEDAVGGGGVYDTQFPINLPGGDIRQLRAMATVDRDPAGRPRRMIGTNWDVTELSRLLALAEDSARSKSEFLATMSHELRTPLNSIIGFSRLALELPGGEAAMCDTARRYVGLVHDASTALLMIVNDVLDFSRIEAGGFELDPAPFPLVDVVESAVEIVRGTAVDKGLTIDWTVADDLPARLVGDSARIRQILLNLLSNAVKFTVDGGISVKVEGCRDPSGVWRIELSVRDTGIGIPKAMRNRLFKRFSQVDQSIARRFGGSGLGLSICDRLTSAMDGSIAVESEESRGSCFRVELPLNEAAAQMPQPHREEAIEPKQSGAGCNILLAEDFELNQMLAVILLERMGHRVEVVGDGAAAVQAAQRGNHDLVLMDIQMPAMDGMEATRRLRPLGGRFASLPIVAMTANVMPDEVDRFHAAGMNAHLAKPIDPDLLAAAIDRWCSPTPLAPDTRSAAG